MQSQREKEINFLLWFTPPMIVRAKSGSQELQSPTLVTGEPKFFCSLLLLFKCIVRELDWDEVAGIWTSAFILGTGIQTSCTTTQAPWLKAFSKVACSHLLTDEVERSWGCLGAGLTSDGRELPFECPVPYPRGWDDAKTCLHPTSQGSYGCLWYIGFVCVMGCLHPCTCLWSPLVFPAPPKWITSICIFTASTCCSLGSAVGTNCLGTVRFWAVRHQW